MNLDGGSVHCGRSPLPASREVERRFWVKVAEGLSNEDAAVACGVCGALGSRWFGEGGGMPSISLVGAGVCEIARRLGRSPSTISRELGRNAAIRGGRLEYRASIAQYKAEQSARRPKVAKLVENDRLRGRQDRRWASAWSPEQIARRLVVEFPDDESMRISHEAIYQALYVQGRGALRRELVACLRTGRALRVPRARVGGHTRGAS